MKAGPRASCSTPHLPAGRRPRQPPRTTPLPRAAQQTQLSTPTTGRPVNVVTLGTLGLDGLARPAAVRLLSQPKRAAVLLYILLSQRGRAVSRDQVLAAFWPESDSARARNALRQTLSFVRSCLGEDAIVGSGSHALGVSPSVDCDAIRFEALLDANRKEEALRLYAGELLPGFHVKASVAFTEWLDAHRRYLSQRAAKAAWDLSGENEGSGDAQGAAFWGKRALALSPFSESEVQRLLRLLARVGDFAGALRAFRGLEHALQSEFGAKPSAETARLASDIRIRIESGGVRELSLRSTQRSGEDRRAATRRVARVEWTGTERRRAEPDRRTGDRRSGHDRREER